MGTSYDSKQNIFTASKSLREKLGPLPFYNSVTTYLSGAPGAVLSREVRVGRATDRSVNWQFVYDGARASVGGDQGVSFRV